MKLFACTLCAVLVVLLAVAGSPAAQTATQSSMAQGTTSAGKTHGTFTVELTKTLDSKKAKVGDAVEAKLIAGITLPNGTMVPRGAKIVGHVTEAKARSKSDPESSLGIVFDKFVRSGGEDMPVSGVIQAVAPNPDEEISTGSSGVGYTDLKQATAAPAAPDTRKGPTPILNDQSQGVLGMKGMQLGPQGVITSNGKDVKLDSGTRILVNATM
ncbi:MAG: hypothetical protein ACLP0B_01675 [Steroidobacteraceae bacterium]|jgi:hypothetical protein